MKFTAIVADDHPIFRKGLVEILSEMKDLEILAEVSNGIDAYQSIIAKRPDVAILDIEMPGLSGLDVCNKVLSEKSETKFIVLTMHRDKNFFNDAMKIGVLGYILKDNAITDMLLCVESVLKGNKYVTPEIEEFLTLTEKENDFPQLEKLTATEKIILKLIAESKTSPEIAALLFVSPNTIDNHRSNIVKKLGLEGKNSLLKFAITSKGLF
ncbi:MAG: DNA-binding response regulator [Bacteroidota bacterium]|jgi:DNA-binding NarL/FixJ family response regulator|nr:DNA-binding response regulator [Bacteroidota bacterium]